MQVTLNIENADNALLNALKSVIKLHPSAKAKVKTHKEPTDELMEAIKEAEAGKVESFKSFDEYKKAMDA